jgi:hypothetical protein
MLPGTEMQPPLLLPKSFSDRDHWFHQECLILIRERPETRVQVPHLNVISLGLVGGQWKQVLPVVDCRCVPASL